MLQTECLKCLKRKIRTSMNQIITTIDGTTFTPGSAILEFTYLLAAVMFVIGLKLLSHPESARRGNLWAASGMILAMITLSCFIKTPQDCHTIKQCHTGNLAYWLCFCYRVDYSKEGEDDSNAPAGFTVQRNRRCCFCTCSPARIPECSYFRSSCSYTSWPLYRKCVLQRKYDSLR